MGVLVILALLKSIQEENKKKFELAKVMIFYEKMIFFGVFF